MFWDELSDRLRGIPLVVGGLGVFYLSDYLPEQYRGLGRGAGALMVAYGTYQIVKKKEEEEENEYEPPEPGEHELDVKMEQPKEGDDWSCMIRHSIVGEVSNPYDKNFKVYAYAMLYHVDEEALYYADSPKEVKVEAYSKKPVVFNVKFDCIHHRGSWRAWILLLSQPDLDHARDYYVGSSRIVSFTVSFV